MADIRKSFIEAEALARQGRLVDAHNAYRAILESDPNNEDARYRLAVVDLMRGNHAAGADRLRTCLEARPDNPDILYSLGRACIALEQYDDAATQLGKAASLSPDRPDILAALGDAHYLEGTLDAALAAYQRAHRLSPADPRIPVNMANALSRLGDHVQALKAARAAYDLAPARPEIALAYANTLRGAGRLDEALDIIRPLLSARPGDPAVVACAAEVLDRMGESNDAAALLTPWLDKADVPAPIARAVGQVAVNRDQAQLTAEAAIPAIERALEGARLNRLDRRGLLFLKANLLQGLGRTEAAFEACTQANDVAGVTYDPEAAAERFASYRRVFGRETLSSLAHATHRTERPLFIVGLARSGTTLVEQILDSHPDVAGGGELEDIPRAARGIDGYPDGLTSLRPDALDRIAADYLAVLDGISPDSRFVTDKMIANTEHLGLISMLFPAARVIHVQRHPLAIGLSCYFQNFRSRNEFTFSLDGFAHYFRHTDELMRHWSDTLDLRIHRLRYEELVRNPRPEIEALLDFCDLPWNDACLAFNRNDRFVDTLSYAQVRKPLTTEPAERHIRYAEQLRPLAEALAEEIERYEADSPA
ncbi:MAG: sulfotransferase [Alphaproteobacteria bacterium]|nr:sulfotransferase [Alphaproteobacteria bacterium]